jgi:hypothetical protein
VHRLCVNRIWLSAALLEFWMELHHGCPVQLQFPVEDAA